MKQGTYNCTYPSAIRRDAADSACQCQSVSARRENNKFQHVLLYLVGILVSGNVEADSAHSRQDRLEGSMNVPSKRGRDPKMAVHEHDP